MEIIQTLLTIYIIMFITTPLVTLILKGWQNIALIKGNQTETNMKLVTLGAKRMAGEKKAMKADLLQENALLATKGLGR